LKIDDAREKLTTSLDSTENVSDSCHVISKPYLARRLRDNNWQNNCQKSQKHGFYKILQENFPKPCFLQL